MARAEPVSISELYSQMLSFETRINLQQEGHSYSASIASRGGRGSSGVVVRQVDEAVATEGAEVDGAVASEGTARTIKDEDEATSTSSNTAATPTTRAPPTTMAAVMTALFVRFASKGDILLLAVGIVLMKIMSPMSVWLLRQWAPTMWTQSGTST